MKLFEKFKALFTAVGIMEEPEANQHGVFVTEEALGKMEDFRTQAEAAQAALATRETALTTAETNLADTQAQLTAAQGELATANSTISTQAAEIADLKAKLSNKPKDKNKLTGDGEQTPEPGKKPASVAKAEADLQKH